MHKYSVVLHMAVLGWFTIFCGWGKRGCYSYNLMLENIPHQIISVLKSKPFPAAYPCTVLHTAAPRPKFHIHVVVYFKMLVDDRTTGTAIMFSSEMKITVHILILSNTKF